MPGFRQSTLVTQIRHDLRERYKGGFPILKELLQNADDAGAGDPGSSATQAVFFLAPGIVGAQHPLLTSPGLCVLNDGDFKPGDAESISRYGTSVRGGQAAAVGKFGLGLKSVFHWAEAFFYFSPHEFAATPTGSPSFDLLQPWTNRETGEGFHKDWDQAWITNKLADVAQFRSLATRLIPAERWFGLWIPLRIRHLLNGVDPICDEWPAGEAGQSATFDSLFGSDWQSRVAEVLPLLRRIKRIRFLISANAMPACIWEVEVSSGAQRLSFLANALAAPNAGTLDLGGRIQCRGENGQQQVAAFTGREKVPEGADAPRWQGHLHWPRAFVQT